MPAVFVRIVGAAYNSTTISAARTVVRLPTLAQHRMAPRVSVLARIRHVVEPKPGQAMGQYWT